MKFLLKVFAVSAVVALIPFSTVQAADTAVANVSYAKLVDDLNPTNKTKAELQRIWKEHQGNEVTWSAILVEAKEGKNYTKLYLVDKSRKSHDGVNILVEAQNKDRAAALKKGQTVRFKGKLDKYNNKSSGSTIITVEKAEVL